MGHASMMWFSAVSKGGGEGGGVLFLCFCGVVRWLWWVSSGIFCSTVSLMQDVMKSLSSSTLLLLLFIPIYTIVKYSFYV